MANTVDYPPNKPQTWVNISIPGTPTFSWIDLIPATIPHQNLILLAQELEFAHHSIAQELEKATAKIAETNSHQGDSSGVVSQLNKGVKGSAHSWASSKTISQIRNRAKSYAHQTPDFDQKVLDMVRISNPSQKADRHDQTIWIISRVFGPQYALLFYADPSTNTSNQSWKERIEMLQYIQIHHDSLHSPAFAQVAREHRLFNSNFMNWFRLRPLLKSELCTVFNQLPLRSKELARMMVFLGGNISQNFLLAGCRYGTWNSLGEVEMRCNAILPDYETCNLDLGNMEARNIVVRSRDSFCVHPALIRYIEETTPYRSEWKLAAIRTAVDAFPEQSAVEPTRFTTKGYAVLPILHYTLSYLWEPGVLDSKYCQSIIKACLSASTFSSWSSKRFFLETARSVCKITADPESRAMVTVREMSLTRLYAGMQSVEIKWETLLSSINRSCPTKNALYGHAVLVMAQQLVDESKDPETIKSVVDRFEPFNQNKISTREHLIIIEGNFLVAKSHRFWGNFETAANLLNQIYITVLENSYRMVWKILPHYCEVLCELGLTNKASDHMPNDLAANPAVESSSRKRLRLALANMHLTKALRYYLQHKRRDNAALAFAEQIFEDLAKEQDPMPSRIRRQSLFAACAGLAMVHHAKYVPQHADGNKAATSPDMKYATSAQMRWEKALGIARQCWPEPGYEEMLVRYALSEISCRFHISIRDNHKTGIGSQRQHYFCGHGTIWVDFLKGLLNT